MDDRLVTMRVLPRLLHPFDDPVFNALASLAGISRDETPEMFDPDMVWGNDGVSEDMPGMPPFEFVAGCNNSTLV